MSVATHGAVGDGVTNDTTAIDAAITAAGVGGTVYFPMTTGDYMINLSLKPLAHQKWLGQVNPRYWTSDPDSMPGPRGRLRAMASFTGSALIHNTATPSYGVVLEAMGIVGNAEDGSVDGIDLGSPGYAERGWLINRCQITWCSTAICGQQHVVTVRECMISRNGWGIAPHRGADTTSRATDCVYESNFIFFNKHHAIELGTATAECGMISIIGNRLERSGVDPASPTAANRDSNACGIHLVRATGISIVSNTTDANSGPALRVTAASVGQVNNVVLAGNVFKRDGSGDNTSTSGSGVALKGASFVTATGNAVSYGTPDDGGGGRVTPIYGVEIDSCNFVNWIGSVDLQSNTETNGYRYLSTLSANWKVTVTDNRNPQLGVPTAATSGAPGNPVAGTTYWDTTLGALRTYSGSAWVTAGGSGSSTASWSGSVDAQGVDLNSLNAVGFYETSNASANSPVAEWGYLIMNRERAGADGDYRVQIWMSQEAPARMYMRNCQANVWQSWVKIGGGDGVALLVASATASAKVKSGADYICDGINDQVEIQAAIDAVRVAGGIVQLSTGNFAIAATVNLLGNTAAGAAFVSPKGITLQGAGRGTMLTAASNINALTISNHAVVSVRDMSITVAGSGHGIHATAVTASGGGDNRSFWHSEFRNLRVLGPWSTGNTTWAMYLESPFRSVFENIEAEGTHDGVYILNNASVQNGGDCSFTRMFLETYGNSSFGIKIESTAGIMNQNNFNMVEAIADGTGCTGIWLGGTNTVSSQRFWGTNLEQFTTIINVANGSGNVFDLNYVCCRDGDNTNKMFVCGTASGGNIFSAKYADVVSTTFID